METTLPIGTQVTVLAPFGSATDGWTGRKMFIAEVPPRAKAGGEMPQYGLAARPDCDAEVYVIRTRVEAPDHSELITVVARALLSRGSFIGERHSVGVYCTAVAKPGQHEWAVLDLQGAPLVLAHDVFDAATWFLMAEGGQVDIGNAGPMPLMSDTERSELARQERLIEWGWLFDRLSNPPAPPASRLRAPGEQGYDKRCSHCADAAPHTTKEHMKSLAAALRAGSAS